VGEKKVMTTEIFTDTWRFHSRSPSSLSISNYAEVVRLVDCDPLLDLKSNSINVQSSDKLQSFTFDPKFLNSTSAKILK
jgi:hypothetical protein